MAADVTRRFALGIAGEEIHAIEATLSRMDPLRYYGAAIEAHYRWIEQQAIRGGDRLSQEILKSLENLTVGELCEVLEALEVQTMGRLRTVWRRLVSPRGSSMLLRLFETMPIEECRGRVGRATLGQVSLVTDLVEQARARRDATTPLVEHAPSNRVKERACAEGGSGCLVDRDAPCDGAETTEMEHCGEGRMEGSVDRSGAPVSSAENGPMSSRSECEAVCSRETDEDHSARIPSPPAASSGALPNEVCTFTNSSECLGETSLREDARIGDEDGTERTQGGERRERVGERARASSGETGEDDDNEEIWDDMDVAYLLLLLLDNEYRERVWEDYDYYDYLFFDEEDDYDEDDEYAEHEGQRGGGTERRVSREVISESGEVSGQSGGAHGDRGAEGWEREGERSRGEWRWVLSRYSGWMWRRRSRAGRGRGATGSRGEALGGGRMMAADGPEGRLVGEHLQANLISSLLHLGLNIPGILNGPDVGESGGVGNCGDASVLARVRAYVDLIGRLQQVADELSSRAGLGVGIGWGNRGLSGIEPGPPPASGASIASLPAVVVHSSAAAAAGTAPLGSVSVGSEDACIPIVCSICRELLEAGSAGRRMPCGHVYHLGCIVSWLTRRNSCPVCRYELPTDDAKYELEKRLRRADSSVY